MNKQSSKIPSSIILMNQGPHNKAVEETVFKIIEAGENLATIKTTSELEICTKL